MRGNAILMKRRCFLGNGTGELKHRESVTHGLESCADAFIGMLKGANFGKTIVAFD